MKVRSLKVMTFFLVLVCSVYTLPLQAEYPFWTEPPTVQDPPLECKTAETEHQKRTCKDISFRSLDAWINTLYKHATLRGLKVEGLQKAWREKHKGLTGYLDIKFSLHKQAGKLIQILEKERDFYDLHTPPDHFYADENGTTYFLNQFCQEYFQDNVKATFEHYKKGHGVTNDCAIAWLEAHSKKA